MKNQEKKDDKKYPGYPHYSKKEDIYKQEKEEPFTDKSEEEMNMGLDVPGGDLDDENEEIGEEDEENNYYSLGGDNHEDLEESEE